MPKTANQSKKTYFHFLKYFHFNMNNQKIDKEPQETKKNPFKLKTFYQQERYIENLAPLFEARST